MGCIISRLTCFPLPRTIRFVPIPGDDCLLSEKRFAWSPPPAGAFDTGGGGDRYQTDPPTMVSTHTGLITSTPGGKMSVDHKYSNELFRRLHYKLPCICHKLLLLCQTINFYQLDYFTEYWKYFPSIPIMDIFLQRFSAFVFYNLSQAINIMPNHKFLSAG